MCSSWEGARGRVLGAANVPVLDLGAGCETWLPWKNSVGMFLRCVHFSVEQQTNLLEMCIAGSMPEAREETTELIQGRGGGTRTRWGRRGGGNIGPKRPREFADGLDVSMRGEGRAWVLERV